MFKKIIVGFLTFGLLCAFHIQSVEAEAISKDKVIAKGYVLIEATTGRVLAGENFDKQLPMASTTKIMTALLTLEQQNLYEDFVVNEQAIKVEGTSMGLKAGDKVSLFALANGMLLSSGNDAANAAAVKIAGSVDAFAGLMNKRAKELSMNHTNFITPSGLHNENHYSTAYDMALLARFAINNPTFSAICKKTNASVTFGNPPFRRTLSNHNRLLKEYEGCIGVKTGFTKKAGRCLVSAAERDGVTLICVTLGAADDWQVHKNLFDEGFANLEKIPIEANVDKLSVRVVGGVKEKASVKAHTNATAPITQDDVAKLTQKVYIDRFVYAPIKQGDVVGEIQHILGNSIVATTTIVANEDVNQKVKPVSKKESFWDKIKHLFRVNR